MKKPYSVAAEPEDQPLINGYRQFIEDAPYPCIAAKAAMTKQHIRYKVAQNMGSASADNGILSFLYAFVEEYRSAGDMYHSAVVIFRLPITGTEEDFDLLLWQRLQGLSDRDACNYPYDGRVSDDPASPSFSFSIKEEAFYIIGLHPASSRPARRFAYPALVFNPHVQFEALRGMMKYEAMKGVVRKRDMLYSGSVNPMLEDFGKRPEVFQYSGRRYDNDWQCPLKIHHGKIDRHPPA